MTPARRSRRSRPGSLFTELQQNLTPVARPNILVLLWRWRYELALLTGIPAAITILVTKLSWMWCLAVVGVIVGTLTAWPEARSWLLAHARSAITAHRVRTGCAEAWIHSRHGKLPIILMTSPKPYGDRVIIWCRAGTCLEDFEEASDILRSACWAHDVQVTSTHYSHIVILGVIRREMFNEAPKPEVN